MSAHTSRLNQFMTAWDIIKHASMNNMQAELEPYIEAFGVLGPIIEIEILSDHRQAMIEDCEMIDAMGFEYVDTVIANIIG